MLAHPLTLTLTIDPIDYVYVVYRIYALTKGSGITAIPDSFYWNVIISLAFCRMS